MNHTKHPSRDRRAERQARSSVFARRVMLSLVGWALILMVACPASYGQGTSKEYKIKLAYLYKFTRYFEWPAHAFADRKDPFVIGVLGTDRFGSSLDSLTKRQMSGRQIVVRRFQAPQQVVGVHLLFVERSIPQEAIDPLIKGPNGGSPLLLVCESPGMGVSGAPVNFFLDGNTIGFEVNVDALGRRKLRANAQLLEIARVVQDQK